MKEKLDRAQTIVLCVILALIGGPVLMLWFKLMVWLFRWVVG
jgi:hypothetical protein